MFSQLLWLGIYYLLILVEGTKLLLFWLKSSTPRYFFEGVKYLSILVKGLKPPYFGWDKRFDHPIILVLGFNTHYFVGPTTLVRGLTPLLCYVCGVYLNSMVAGVNLHIIVFATLTYL